MIITILRWYFKILLRLYYKEISITGSEYIKADKPQLFISNHQNSLVDGLLYITQIDKDVMMTTTSKLKKFPLATKILQRANVQIFYRRVDGYSDRLMKKNVSTLDKIADLLADDNHVLIFPEGFTTEDGYMLPFKTGFARTVKSYVERYDKELEIVPIYLNYTDRKKIRSKVSVDIQEPISAHQLADKYPDNFVENTVDHVKGILEEVEQTKIHEAEDEAPESLRYLDRVLAFPFLIFYMIPSALVIMLGDLINPREETKATTRIFISVVIFPVAIFLQVLLLFSLLPILWVYFLISYAVIYLYQYTKGIVERTKARDGKRDQDQSTDQTAEEQVEIDDQTIEDLDIEYPELKN